MKVAPVDQLFSHKTPADSVISTKLQFPLLRYNALFTILPVKYISIKPSLFMSPNATPPPLKKFLYVYGLKSSVYLRVFLKFTPVISDDFFSNLETEFSQEKDPNKITIKIHDLIKQN